jgi:hypothetical protein
VDKKTISAKLAAMTYKALYKGYKVKIKKVRSDLENEDMVFTINVTKGGQKRIKDKVLGVNLSTFPEIGAGQVWWGSGGVKLSGVYQYSKKKCAIIDDMWFYVFLTAERHKILSSCVRIWKEQALYQMQYTKQY